MHAPRPAKTARTRLTVLLGCGCGLTALWAGAATYALVFHDAVLARFLARQGVPQARYEARIADMQARLDRAASDRSLTREAVEVRLSELAERQAALEKRQAALAEIAAAPAAEPEAGALPAADSAPLDALDLRTGDGPAPAERHSAHGLGPRLAAFERSLDVVAKAQSRGLQAITARAGRGAGQLKSLLARTGVDPARFERPVAGLGGPLVPVSADAFAIDLARAQRVLGDEQRLRRVTGTLPLRRPLLGAYALSSGFGTRIDPFTRGLALHTGLDLKAETGEPARATAPGRVTAAEAAGGYGNMVEIDHGHGVTTRYAHLARLGVAPGQWVQAGDVVGRVGSTGRSTGSHLHYETRIDGEPVDPQRFLRAGAQLDAWQFNVDR
ncbi:M23 family metallopeptidase [Methylobacterium nigriterrae]|uniref:M23 family metallopeptidase n=1 Tax=Methylobacterium nigriterrae TaxID=3127512 RepID=UPI0030137D33